MDYYEGIVEKYVSSDRETFISSQFYLKSSLKEFWIDAVAVNVRTSTIYLCEVTFSKSLYKIIEKTKLYVEHHDVIKSEICAAACIPESWNMRPWLFLLKDSAIKFAAQWKHPIKPKMTYLESTAPWFISNGFRASEPGKPYPDLSPDFQ